MRVDDADLLDEVLQETVEYSADLKALVLRMVHHQQGDPKTVAQLTGLPLSTIYHWLGQWNQTERDTKKNARLVSGRRGWAQGASE